MPDMTPQFTPAIYAAPEDLPSGFQKYVVKSHSITVLRHPFYTDFFPLALPLPIEEMVAKTQERADAARASGDYRNFIFLHARPFRMDTLRLLLLEGAFKTCPETYWAIARTVWMDAEQPESDLRWRFLIEAKVPGREAMMTPKDRAALDEMPKTLTLYRGIQAPDKDGALASALDGFSWTLSLSTATRFAHRHLDMPDKAWIARTEIPKTDVIAYLSGRGEEEIILDSTELFEQEIGVEPADPAPLRDFVSLNDFFKS